MTDESLAEGSAFVEGRINARHCPFCGAEHWILMPDIKAFTGASGTTPDALTEEGEVMSVLRQVFHPAVSYYCRECGFVRTHILPD